LEDERFCTVGTSWQVKEHGWWSKGLSRGG
jgi:hypothetical protein